MDKLSDLLEEAKVKNIIEGADMTFEDSDALYRDWKLEEKFFKQKYGKHFSSEDHHTMLAIFKNSQQMQIVYQLFVNNFRKGKQIVAETKEAHKDIEEITKEQQKLIKKLNKKLKVSDDLSYKNYKDEY